MITYKLFRLKHGKLYPLYVNANKPTPLGVWLDAEAGERTSDGKVKSRLGKLAYRPGWHSGDMPVALHIGEKKSLAMLSQAIAHPSRYGVNAKSKPIMIIQRRLEDMV